MQKFATLFKQYAMWLQATLILLITLTLAFTSDSAPRRDPQSYLQMLGNLTLPYLISGDRNGLQQSLDLLIQDTFVLDAQVLNTENRPLVQVVNRAASEQERDLSSQATTELVLDQTLLGTLSISTPSTLSEPPAGLILLSIIALLLGLGQLMFKRGEAEITEPEKRLGSQFKKRFLIAISLTPLVEQIKRRGRLANNQVELSTAIIRRLAPSYGLEYVAINDETLFLQSSSDDKLSLRQAIVFSWNACQSLGTDKGTSLRASICTADLPSDTLIGNLTMVAGDQLEICSDLQAGSAAGTVSLNQELAATLPAEWDATIDRGKQKCTISELPAAVCNLWRRQLNNLSGAQTG